MDRAEWAEGRGCSEGGRVGGGGWGRLTRARANSGGGGLRVDGWGV